MKVNASIIYYSATGITYQMALAAAEAAEKAGAEVRLRKVRELAAEEAVASNEGWAAHRLATQDIPEATLDDLDWSHAVIFGTPSRYGNVSAQLKQFIDTSGPLWAQGKLANKVYAGFCSAATAHGGHETTLTALFHTIYHWGGIVVTPGYTEPGQFVSGNPYGGSHSSSNGEIPPDQAALTATALTARRAVWVASAMAQANSGS